MINELNILPPIMPNFFFYEEKPGRMEDGFKQKESHPITDFTKEEAEEFAELMKETFMKHWEFKKTADN